MSIKIALLKSNEEIIADVKEFVSEEEGLVSYCFKEPYVIKVRQTYYDDDDIDDDDIGDEELVKRNKFYSVVFAPWIILSKNKDFLVNPDWVVTLYDPDDDVEQAYLEELDGRSGNDGHDGSVGRD
jgi:hypothetical protein